MIFVHKNNIISCPCVVGDIEKPRTRGANVAVTSVIANLEQKLAAVRLVSAMMMMMMIPLYFNAAATFSGAI